MAQSLSNVLLHVVFSTKDRRAIISTDAQTRLYAYLAEATRQMNCPIKRVGGVEDLVHLALELSRTITIAKLVEGIKSGSSKWMKESGLGPPDFAWQRGYAAFSISSGQLPGLLKYIDGQAEHHRKVDFQEEFRQLMADFDVAFDERYVWD